MKKIVSILTFAILQSTLQAEDLGKYMSSGTYTIKEPNEIFTLVTNDKGYISIDGLNFFICTGTLRNEKGKIVAQSGLQSKIEVPVKPNQTYYLYINHRKRKMDCTINIFIP